MNHLENQMVFSYAKLRNDYLSEQKRSSKLCRDNKKLIDENIKLKAELAENHFKNECYCAIIIDQTLQETTEKASQVVDSMLDSEK